MRESHFRQLMDDEFGDANAGVISSSLVLPGLDMTAEEALSAGVEPRDVWVAVCDLHQVPVGRRLGRDIAPRDTGVT